MIWVGVFVPQKVMLAKGTIHRGGLHEEGILGLELFFVTGLVKFVTAVARLVCPDLLG